MWRTSTRSGGEGDCVEVAAFAEAVGVRDSKDRQGPTLSFAPAAWAGFVGATRAGRVAASRSGFDAAAR
ncbi:MULTISPECIES: DUF397 domain-containing protein [Micromonospora]|uniref:DUF397 domain-containing protein n=1 Tax=Micromonospora TaxID=1873 RepID=UPI00098D6700|nr:MULTISPECIES: DUF397 domain-containing protein [unclassified Micromonospora]MDI5943879.1 DUF397 domain-containing protein [Micromonospora sp. DH15]OON31633.1 DUF397 domain-containing protein [Micromonospora sp. Rc5]